MKLPTKNKSIFNISNICMLFSFGHLGRAGTLYCSGHHANFTALDCPVRRPRRPEGRGSGWPLGHYDPSAAKSVKTNVRKVVQHTSLYCLLSTLQLDIFIRDRRCAAGLPQLSVVHFLSYFEFLQEVTRFEPKTLEKMCNLQYIIVR